MEIFQRLSKSILNEKYTVSVCKSALKVVLNCMLLGEVGQGHRIVDVSGLKTTIVSHYTADLIFSSSCANTIYSKTRLLATPSW